MISSQERLLTLLGLLSSYSVLAESKMVTLACACPFKCRAPEVLIVDENDEAEQQRASLPAGLLLQAQQAEHTADAA